LPRLPRHEFDRAYLERLIAEDPETERHFAAYFGELLTLKLRSRLRSPALADDARQETLLRVLTALKTKKALATPEALGAFVNGVCNNVLLELYRSGSRTTPLEDDNDPPDERQRSAETTRVDAADQARVRTALASLPDRERDLLRALFFEERDKDSICRDFNIDRNYLRVLVHRAKSHFRKQFEHEEAG
jgi:RNA polymerase sigma-70 factor (ECF subfamily)